MTPEFPPELIEDRIFRQFPGWVWSQRIRPTNSWIWNEGYDIQRESIYRWMCKTCAKLNKPRFAHFNAAGLQNAREHLWRKHNISAPEGEKKGVAESHAEDNPQPFIMTYFRLNPVQLRD
jgi:hypothetical protein